MRRPLVARFGWRDGWPAVVLGGSTVAAVFLRLPFLHVGLSPDEGGYAYAVARLTIARKIGKRAFHALLELEPATA